MKPSRDNRCARRVAGDFIIGLVLFIAVFVLATLDTRAARSAPVFMANTIAPAQSGMHPAALFARLERPVIIDISPTPPREEPLASEDIPFILPEDRVNEENFTAPGANRPARLASRGASRTTRGLAVPGMKNTTSRGWALFVMALIFAIMTALTLGLWRHLRTSVVRRRGGRRT